MKNQKKITDLVIGKFSLALLFTLSQQFYGQTASHYGNSIPISGTDCSAFGFGALSNNTTGSNNVGVGRSALNANTVRSNNTAIGFHALLVNTGGDNTAIGYNSLVANTSGRGNTAAGWEALYQITTGTENTGLGYRALTGTASDKYNSGMGTLSNVAATADNQTAIGAQAQAAGANNFRLGHTGITIIACYVPLTTISDGRAKVNVRESDTKGLEFVLLLRPVVYNLDVKKLAERNTSHFQKQDFQIINKTDYSEAQKIRRSGFIAQEVELAAQKLGFEFKGVKKPQNEQDIYGLSYSQFVMPLVKAVQEQQLMILDLQNDLGTEASVISNESKGFKNILATTGTSDTDGFNMKANRPNPFSKETVIEYTLPAQIEDVELVISDLSGKQLISYPVREREQGSITVTVEKLNPGIYIYTMIGDKKVMGSKRMIVTSE